MLRESLAVTDRFSRNRRWCRSRLDDRGVLIHLLNLLQVAFEETLVQMFEVLFCLKHDFQAATPVVAIQVAMIVFFFLL